MYAKIKKLLFRCIIFTVTICIVGLSGVLLRIEELSYQSPVGKRSSLKDNAAISVSQFDINVVNFTVLSDSMDKKESLNQHNVRDENSPIVGQKPLYEEISSLELQVKDLGIAESSHSRITSTETGFRHTSTVMIREHGYDASVESLQSPTKDFKPVDQVVMSRNSGLVKSIPQSRSNMQLSKIGIANQFSKSVPLMDRLKISATTGYVLAVNYYEQQSMGSRNLFQLQCWAQCLGLSVVKPVMKDSFLLTPLDQGQQQSLLKLEDSFDLYEWNKLTSASKYAPLVGWSKFMSNAPRNVILVQYNYPSVSVLKSRQKAGEPVLQDHIGDRYKSGCESSKWPTPAQLAFLKTNVFHIVRSVCFNFYHGDQLTVDEFNAHILGEHLAANVTIIMDLWRGLGTGQRVLIKDTCAKTFPINEQIKLSERLLRDATRYTETYLKGGGSQTFLAIMGRLEMTLLTVRKKEPVLPFCLKEIVSQLNAFKRDTGINATFLSIDIGRYGSKKWRTNVDPDLKHDFSDFVQNIYGPSTSVMSWESTFEAVTATRDAGYIGLLQKAIVTKARCILFIGGGAFQRHALHLYRQLHPIKKDQCLRVVSSCTSPTKFVL